MIIRFKTWNFITYLCIFFLLTCNKTASAQTGFEIFKTEAGNIDLAIIGNGVHQLVDDLGITDPASFYSRSSTTGNNFMPFIYLDDDNNSTTFNSSSASYTMPIGHELVSVTLHVGGFGISDADIISYDPDDLTAAGLANGPLPTATYDRRDVQLSFDGGVNYTIVSADAYRKDFFAGGFVFTSSYDITTAALAGITGNQLDITLANLVLRGPFTTDSASVSGGWTAQIITRAPGFAFNKSVIVYEGLAFTDASTVDINISGFLTPLVSTTGPLVTIMAGDGDLNANDFIRFGSNAASLTEFQDALHANDDVANSRGTFKSQYFTDLSGFTRSPIRDRDVIDIIGLENNTPILPPLSTEAVLQVEAVLEGISYHSLGLMFEVDPLDWGDAPDSYLTSGGIGTSNEGPAHILPTTVFLGDIEPDSDPSGIASNDSQGDDNSGAAPDDEDGVFFPVIVSASTGDVFGVDIVINGTGFLNGWLDWNRDGQFQSTELITTNDQVVVSGTTTLNVTVPAGAVIGESYSRFRICSVANECNSPGGLASDGEVEDYAVNLALTADISVQMSVDAGLDGLASAGESLSYDISLVNTGDTPKNYAVGEIEELVPVNTNHAGSDDFTCVSTTAGSACSNNSVFQVPAASGGNPGVVTLNFAVTVNDPLPANVTTIINAVIVPDECPDVASGTNVCDEITAVIQIVGEIVTVPVMNIWAVFILCVGMLMVFKLRRRERI